MVTRTMLPLLLLAALMAMVASAATVTLPPLPAHLWTNSAVALRASIGAAAPAGSGDRLALDCGGAVAVTVAPAGGFCLDQSRTQFDFVVKTGAAEVPAGVVCAFVLTGSSFDALPQQSTTPVPVLAQRTLTVSPSSSLQSPIIAGPDGSVVITFTPSADLSQPRQVQVQCAGMSNTAPQATVLLKGSPASVTVSLANAVGFAECRFTVDDPELIAPLPTVIQVVAPTQLVATGIPIAGAVVGSYPADALAAATTYTVSVAPPTVGQEFVLTLTCEGSASISHTFTAATTVAKTFSVMTPTAPAAGASVVVGCGWSGAGVGHSQRLIALPQDFAYYLGGDFIVTAEADSLDVNEGNNYRTSVTLSAPAGTVFLDGRLPFEWECSVGRFDPDPIRLYDSELTKTFEYIYEPMVGAAATTAECTIRLENDGDFRRVKAPIPPLRFNIAAAPAFPVFPNVQPIVTGLPLAADVVSDDVPGMVPLATAIAGVTITLTVPIEVSMAASSTPIVLRLACAATYGSTVAVTPSDANFNPDSTGPAEFVITASAPLDNVRSDLIACIWTRISGAVAMPANFNFFVGTAVQLEVQQVATQTDTAFFPIVPVGHIAHFYIQSAELQATKVASSVAISVSCRACASEDHPGEARVEYMHNLVVSQYPRPDVARAEFRAVAPGVVTCEWRLDPSNTWSRALIAPVPSRVVIVPRLPVKGFPTPEDAIPLMGERYFAAAAAPMAVLPGSTLTLSMPAAPVEIEFGSETNTFSLMCEDVVTEAQSGAVSGEFHYSAANRGAQSVVLTMPQLVDDQAILLYCGFYIQGKGPATIADGSGAPHFQVLVASSKTALTIRGPASGEALVGEEVSVWLDPAKTATLPATDLIVHVVCALSGAVKGMAAAPLGLAKSDGSFLQADRFMFSMMSQSSSITLTKGTTDSALQFGYKLRLPAEPGTLTCSHMIQPSSGVDGQADRMLSLESESIVITVLPRHTIAVTGVPTAPLSTTPTEQTISVKPTLRDGAVFTPQQTIEVALLCPGLTLSGNGLLSFTGTGAATVAAKLIKFTPPAVAAGAGKVWQCSWQLGGSDAAFFAAPADFVMLVGTVYSIEVQLESPDAPRYASKEKRGQLVLPGCMPSAGTIRAECDQGQALVFHKNFQSAVPLDATDTVLSFGISGWMPGTFSCRFILSDVPSDFPLLTPQPLTVRVVAQASFAVAGPDALTRQIELVSGGEAALSVAPREPPGPGGVELALGCYNSNGASSIYLPVDKFFFPEGSVTPQTFRMKGGSEGNGGEASCGWELLGADKAHFSGPDDFYVRVHAQRTIVVAGLDAQGRIVSPDPCSDISIAVAPSSMLPGGQPVTFFFDCGSGAVSPGWLVFSSTAPESAVFPATGAPFTTQCRVYHPDALYAEKRFTVVFGAPHTITVTAPSFMPLGSAVGIRVAMSSPVSTFEENYLMARCNLGVIMPEGWLFVNGQDRVEVPYYATGTPPQDFNLNVAARSTVTMAKSGPVRAQAATSAAASATPRPRRTNKKEKHEQRQRRAVRPFAMSAAAAVAVSLASVSNDVVTCMWGWDGTDQTRYHAIEPTTFIVGAPVGVAAALEDSASSVVQGDSVALIVTPTVAAAVDVDLTVECSHGVSASASTVTLAAGAVSGPSITLTVAADAELGSASCTLTPTGRGQLAVSSPTTAPFTVVEPAPAVPSSTGGGSSDSSSPSSTGDGGSSASDWASTGEPAGASPSSSATDGSSDSDSTGSDSAASVSSSTGSESTASDWSSAGSDTTASGSTGPASSSSGPSTDDRSSGQSPEDEASSTGDWTATGTSSPFSSSSSTGGGGGVPIGSSSSSSGTTDPCPDFECGALSADSLPGLAALVAMLLATAFAQRQ